MKDTDRSDDLYIEEHFTLSITEVCHSLGIQKQWILEVLEEGIIQPVSSGGTSSPQFDQSAIRRLRTSICLQRDLGINLSGIALILDLLDELEELRRKSTA